MIQLINLIKNTLIVLVIGPLFVFGFIFGYCLRSFLRGGFAGYFYEYNLDQLEQQQIANANKNKELS